MRLDQWGTAGGVQRFAANGGIDLVGAEIRGSLTCTGAQLAGSQGGNALTADRVRVGRNVSFDQALTQSGALRLAGASIVGRLDCRGAQLNGVDDGHRALVAQGMRIGDDMLLTEGFAARGGVDLVDAEIAGFLTCTGAQLAASGEGDALTAERIKVGKNASFDQALVQAGSLQLGGASIVGRLDCRGAQLNGVDEDGAALVAYRMKAGYDVLLADGFTSAGGINLIDAEITGSLTCTGAQLAASHDGSALAAKRIKARNVRLNGSNTAGVVRPFTAAGTIDLTSADISGELNCADAYLRGTDIPGVTKGYALYANGAKVGGDVNLGQKFGKFTATGAIQLSGADIAGRLVLNNSFLIGTDGRDNALCADELKVHGNVDLMRIFAVGTVSLKSATVGGDLRLKPLKLAGSRHQVDKDKIALDVSGAKIAQELEWEPEAPVHGRVILEHATVGRLTDNWTGPRLKSGFWPLKARLSLDGLTYTTIGGDHSADLNLRLKWIRSQYPGPPAGTTRFAAQPYELWPTSISRLVRIPKPARSRSPDAGIYANMAASRGTVRLSTGCWIKPSSMVTRLGVPSYCSSDFMSLRWRSSG